MTRAIILSILSGVALVFAFPPFSLGFLAWFALVPLMVALEGLGPKGGFAAGFASGAAFNLGAVYWVVHSMYNYGGVPVPLAIAVMLALVAYMALYWGAFGLLYSFAKGAGDLPRAVFAAASWVALEYARAHILTGFPWVLIGYTQAPYAPLMQVADLAGVWGVSFALVASNAALAMCASCLLAGGGRDRLPVKALVAAVAVAVSVGSYGAERIKAVDREAAGWKQMRVGLAQGSIDQGVKWDGRFQQQTIDIYGKLTKEAAASGASLVVWPETAIPFYYDPDEVKAGQIGEIARQSGTYILTGSPAYNYNPGANKVSYYNSAFLMDPLGGTLGRYDKFHLVPFGEYLPLRGILPFEKLTAGIGDFTEGSGPVPVAYDGASLGTLICFESIFPEIARGHVMNGANLLVTITNDAWFGRTSAPSQHLQMSVFRAVENRSYLVRAANTGISAIIDPAGRVVKETGLYERTVVVGDARLREGRKTLYTEYGDFFAWGCVAAAAAFLASRTRRPGRPGPPNH